MATTKRARHSFLKRDIGGVSLGARALFARHLAVMLKAGLTLTEALKITQESARGTLKNVLQDVRHAVTAGRSFADALSDHANIFSGFFVSAVRAGEASGTLEKNLEHLAVQLEKDKAVSSKIQGALVYPSVILIATFIMGMVVAFFVLPQITPLFTGLKMELPPTTKALIAFSKLVQQAGLQMFAGIVGGVFFVLWLLRRKFSQPFTHFVFLRTPIISPIVHAANLSRFTRTLGMLLASGLRIDEAVEITKETLGNYYYRRSLAELSKRITKGSTLYENLELYPRLFPLVVTHMIRVGEESGRLEDTLLYLGDYYESEVDGATKALSTVIEPILLLGIGGAVAFLALSIITPIYNITSSVRR